MGLLDRLQTHIQTDDAHKNEVLRTQYFAASPNAMLTWLNEKIVSEGQTVRRVDAERGELSFKGQGWDALATIVQVEGGKTAVDFTMNREQMLGPDLTQIVTKYYKALQVKFPIRAIGNESVER